MQADTAPRRTAVATGALIAVGGVVLLLWPGATLRVLAVVVAVAAIALGVRELTRVFAGGERLALAAGMLALSRFLGGLVVLVAALAAPAGVRPLLGALWVVLGVAELVGPLLGRRLDPERAAVGFSSLVLGAAVLLLSDLARSVLVALAGIWAVLAGVSLVTGSLLAPRLGGGARPEGHDGSVT